MVRAVEEDRTLNATRVAKDFELNPTGLTARSITNILNAHGLKDLTEVIEVIDNNKT